MKAFAAKYPLAFGALLFFAALLAAGLITAVLGSVGFEAGLASAIARLIVALALLALFRSCFAWEHSFTGIRWVLPALIFVAWNVVYQLSSGMGALTPDLAAALVMGLAPALFEETVFRGIVIGKLREKGAGLWYSLFGSAVLFSAVHLTNIVGMDLPSLLVQLGYSLVIGLFLGAVYLKTADIASVVLAHAAVDISNQLFLEHPTTASTPMLIVFCVVLVLATAYALWIARGIEAKQA